MQGDLAVSRRPWNKQRQLQRHWQTAEAGRLELGEDHADAADDVVGWGLVSGQGEQLDGELA